MRADCTCIGRAWSRDCPIASHRWYARKAEGKMERTWTTVAERNVERVGGRDAIEAKIAGLDWRDAKADGTVGAFQGAAINACIAELGLPRVSAYAVDAFEIPGDADHDGFYPGFYGIECTYANGRARVYVLDTGTEVTPVCSDFPVETAAVAA